MKVSMRVIFVAVLLVAAVAIGKTKQESRREIGTIDKARFRIDVPAPWNRGLVIYSHGYDVFPSSYDDGPPDEITKAFLDLGYAVAQSGFSGTGWVVKESQHDIDGLRQHFVDKFGQPDHTYAAGMSMGGFITMMMLETEPRTYQGGLALCAPLASPSWFIGRRVFDLRVVFDYYFPGVLPSPAAIPQDYIPSTEEFNSMMELLARNPEKTAAISAYSGIRNENEIVNSLQFFSLVLKDLRVRSGGNAFDNRDTVYSGTLDDAALNKGVKRYSADPRADEYMRKNYTPSGEIQSPLLSVQNLDDPLMPGWVKNAYASLVDAHGRPDLFVQTYVAASGHCSISPQEITAAMAQLGNWRATGTPPSGGLLQVAK